MKKTRIYYIEHKYRDNTMISASEYTSKSTGAKYRVILDLENMEWSIRNERNKGIVKKSNRKYTNLNVLKRVAREALEQLGVELIRESRNRTFGKCEKNWSQAKQVRIERERRERDEEL